MPYNQTTVLIGGLMHIPLIILGGCCYFFSSLIVPILFGENWAVSGALLSLMSGVVIFHSLFEILKSYCWQARQMRWLLLARVAQYLGAIMPLIMLGSIVIDIASILAIGQSLAFIFGFVVLLYLLNRAEQR